MVGMNRQLILFLGRHNHITNLCTHTQHYRGGGGRRDWCRAPPQRHPRRRRWYPQHTHHKPARIAARSTSPLAGYRQVLAEGPRWRPPRQPRHPRKPPRRIQPSTQPHHTQACWQGSINIERDCQWFRRTYGWGRGELGSFPWNEHQDE